MKETTPAVLIRIFHRWSGLMLIFLLTAKLISGFRLAGEIHFPGETAANRLHFSHWVDVPLVFFFIFHSTYGVLKILMSKGIRKKVRAFLVANAAAILLFVLIIGFIL